MDIYDLDGLLLTSGENFLSVAHLEIYLLKNWWHVQDLFYHPYPPLQIYILQFLSEF